MTRTTRAGLVIIAATLLGAAGAVWYGSSPIPLVPVLNDGPDMAFTDHPELLTPEFQREFKRIADGYAFTAWRAEDGTLTVPRISARTTREMIWNLTTKTLDKLEAQRQSGGATAHGTPQPPAQQSKPTPAEGMP